MISIIDYELTIKQDKVISKKDAAKFFKAMSK